MKPCACGRRGIYPLSGEQYECQRCHDIDRRRYQYERDAQQRSLGKISASRPNRVRHMPEYAVAVDPRFVQS